ncbi:hypothetical protein HDV00_012334 [Rhizophlyctis rosea]|nr:hypothetical protein HDV00_012334 [Rhizophlyctis rosea]
MHIGGYATATFISPSPSSNTFYYLDFSTIPWTTYSLTFPPGQWTNLSIPDPRTSTRMCFVSAAMSGSTIYTWGGAILNGTTSDVVVDVFEGGWVIDVSAKTKPVALPKVGNQPEKRMRASMVMVDGDVVLYGGFAANYTPEATLHIYSPSSATWDQTTSPGVSHGLWGHAAVVALPKSDSKQSVVFYGGWNGQGGAAAQYTSDLTYLNKEDGTWSWGAHISRQGLAGNVGRSGIAAALVASRRSVVTFGGVGQSTVFDPNMYVYQYDTQTWLIPPGTLPAAVPTSSAVPGAVTSSGAGMSKVAVALVALGVVLGGAAAVGIIIFVRRRRKFNAEGEKKRLNDDGSATGPSALSGDGSKSFVVLSASLSPSPPPTTSSGPSTPLPALPPSKPSYVVVCPKSQIPPPLLSPSAHSPFLPPIATRPFSLPTISPHPSLADPFRSSLNPYILANPSSYPSPHLTPSPLAPSPLAYPTPPPDSPTPHLSFSGSFSASPSPSASSPLAVPLPDSSPAPQRKSSSIKRTPSKTRISYLLSSPHTVKLPYAPRQPDEIDIVVGDEVRVKIAYDDG